MSNLLRASDQLHPETAKMVAEFTNALSAKLLAAQLKFGLGNNWQVDDWEDACRKLVSYHVEKGDPLDLAAYAAFCWARGWSTTPPEKPEMVTAANKTDLYSQLMYASETACDLGLPEVQRLIDTAASALPDVDLG